MTSQYLRVIPHANVAGLRVPLGDGRHVRRDECPAHGVLVPDSHFVRRRIRFAELELLAEGEDALHEPVTGHDGGAA